MTFAAPAGLRNTHVQTVLAGSPLRQWLLRDARQQLTALSHPWLMESRSHSRLLGLMTPATSATPTRTLVILLHGWEGSADSCYMIASARALHRAGFSVLRLNFRDHGPTHHLNHDLFNSTRLDEVGEVLSLAIARLQPDHTVLAGFSLGGNFALRLASRTRQYNLPLQRVLAINPVISPRDTMADLEAGSAIYHRYFVQRWKRSLATKLALFPDLGYGPALRRARTLGELNAFFVPGYTPYANPASYLDAYAVSGDRLTGLAVPAHIIASLDDPITRAHHLGQLAPHPLLTIEQHAQGGHCAFLQDWALESWLDQRLVQWANER